MKKLELWVLLAVVCFLGAMRSCASYALADSGGYCIDVQPICKPGREPICVCTDIAQVDCRWLCVSRVEW